MKTWEKAKEIVGINKTKTAWEYELDTYHIWIEHGPCGDFPTVIEGADGIYQISSTGKEPIGYFLNPMKAENHARDVYGVLWQDDGKQLMPYEISEKGNA